MLRELIASQNVKNAIIFCNRKVEVAILHKSLVKHGFSAGALHGDMDQKARMETLDKFRAGELMLLAASDVAARGLDIPDVSHIFNFDLPWQPDDYVHRIGRTGRAGKEGVSISLVTLDELKSLKDIEKMLGEPVELARRCAVGGRLRRSRQEAPRSRRPCRPPRVGVVAAGRARSARGDDKGRRDEHRVHGRAPEQRAEGRSERPERAAEPRRQDAGRPEATAQRPHTQQPQEPRRQEAQAPRPPRQEQPRREQPRQEQPQQESRRQEGQRQEHRQESSRRAQAAAASPSRSRQRPGHQPRPERQRQQPRGRGEGQQQPARAGFADNIPAFLRKPVKRPVKVASE